jgi:hypothetical protein
MRIRARQGLRRWLGRGSIAALLWTTLAIAPSGAGAAVSDVGCPGPPDTVTITRSGDQREAQVFTPQHTGNLTRVTVELTNPGASLLDPVNDFVVQILLTDSGGAPSRDALATVTVPNVSVPVGTATLDVAFPNPPDVVAGHKYAVLIARPGTFTSFQPHTRSGDKCEGAAFWSSGPNAAYASEAAGTDLVFQTYVKPSNKFTLVGKKGRLYARVPGPGHLMVDDPPGGKGKHKKKRAVTSKRRDYVKRTQATAKAAGDTLLRLKLTKSAIRRVLATRRLNLHVGITYTPDGGDPNLERFTLKVRI